MTQVGTVLPGLTYFYLYLVAVAAQNKNICPGRVSNPPQTPFMAATLTTTLVKIFFSNRKNF